MNRVILFSPVGGTDPVSESNMQDGALIHICRFYRPDTVYLYLTGEMVIKHNSDNRYIYCLERLAENLNIEIKCIPIEKPNLIKVQEFDFFYKEFLEIINDIRSQMDESDKLLINISSGTPAMKSGLLVLYSISDFDATLIQVSTPVKSMNEHHHDKNLNIKDLWECNIDNDPDTENRCKEVNCPTLENLTSEKIIEQHLKAYDYSAAYLVAKTLKKNADNYLKYIEAAVKRNSLDYYSAMNVFSGSDKKNIFPVQDGLCMKYFEYIQNLDIKCRRQEFADFIRAISPIVLELFIMAVKNKTGINVHDYTIIRNNVEKWDKKRLTKAPEIDTILNNAYSKEYRNFDYSFIKSDHLLKIIENKISDKDILILAQEIRDIEQTVRNIAAHQIAIIDNDYILKETKLSASKICDKLKKLFNCTCRHINDDCWNSYDYMNNYIIERIKEKWKGNTILSPKS